MSGKKILVLSNMYPTETAKSFGIFVKNQVEALRGRGLHVDVIAVTNPRTDKVNVLTKYILWLLRTLIHCVTKGRNYDVVHAHYVFPTGMLGLWYKKWWKAKLVVTAHGGDIDRMANKSGRIRQWTTTILREADHVIAVGHKLAEQIRNEFGVPEENVSVINMGVNRRIFQPLDKEEARKRCGIGEHEIPILFVGNIIRQKGLIELVEAFSKLKKEYHSVSLYLIGAKKDNAFYHELIHRVKEAEINDVHILDAMQQKDVAVWMAAAEMFVLPSHLEGFGLVALEAMSCHTPVVGSRVGGLAYLLGDGAGVLVEPGNPDSLFEGMKKLLDDAALRKQLVQKGEARAQENDQERIIDQILQLYDRV
ncbi:glycosyltransferase [Parageobacillus thermoglucosidasius]|nr:glycosyltransferase [Parageobacillus thermoglucosidasius]BDG30638.1 LPS biosynthesis protein RfbU [Parageobacillus thermoglucosidasius]